MVYQKYKTQLSTIQNSFLVLHLIGGKNSSNTIREYLNS